MGNAFSNMSKFANTNPADIIYEMALGHFCSVGRLTKAEIRKKQLEDPFKTMFETHKGTAKFTPALQKTFSPHHIDWIKDIGIGCFLWDELDPAIL